MKSFKIAAILALGVSLFAAAVIGAMLFIFTKPDPVVDRADRFMQHIRENRIAIAYESTTPAFQAVRGVQEFRSVIEDSGLNRVGSVQWFRRETADNGAVLFGRGQIENGGAVYLRLGMAKGEIWRVNQLDVGDAARPQREVEPDGGTPGETEDGTPEARARDRLVLDTLLAFNDAVQSKDFSRFHQRLATPFREQHEPAEVQKAFQDFIDDGLDISAIRDSRPVYTEATDPSVALDEGRMQLKGYYPTAPSRLDFELTFVREDEQWRLFRIKVVVAPPTE